MRNIKQALIFRDEMHARGAVVYVVDERILSSDERGWDEWVREAHDAEAFSRKHSRRVGEGYEAKRRRLGVPGGNRPPFGYLRARSDPTNPRSPQQLIEDSDKAQIVRRAFELSASGLTDREVAVTVGLKVTHLREVLSNPVYIGRLRTGEDSGGPPLVSQAALGHGHGRPLPGTPGGIGGRCPDGRTPWRPSSRAPRVVAA